MDGFDPHLQTVRFKAADGETDIQIPIPLIDKFNVESVSICINYGTQLGACLVMLLIVLITTPSTKMRRPSTILHISALIVCIIRMALLSAFFPSSFNEFYNYWGVDYASVPLRDYQISVAGNIFSLLLVIAIEIALVNQAWVMVKLWPTGAKYTLSAISMACTLLTIGWRITFTILLSQSIFSAETARPIRWVVKWSIITNAVSISWYCALFNAKLMIHLVTNRSILPSYKSLTPMEALVMTNGILMTVPVIFTGLEFGHWANFEAASLALTSVALVLPLGTLFAQRLSQSYGLEYERSADQGNSGFASHTNGSHRPLKVLSSYATSSTRGTPHISVSSHCKFANKRRVIDPEDVELARIDSCDNSYGQVRVDYGFEQREEHL